MSLLSTLGRHQLAAIGVTILDFGTMTFIVSVLHKNAELGTIIGAGLGGITNFMLGRHWIFGGTHAPAVHQALRYAFVSGSSLALNTVGEYFLHERLGVEYLIARVIVAATISLLWNFPMQRHFVFPQPPATFV